LASSFTTHHTFHTAPLTNMSQQSSREPSPVPSDHEYPALPSSPGHQPSSKIVLARTPPMFDGLTKSKWETFAETLSNYIWAYESEFDTDKKKISFTIQPQCTAIIILRVLASIYSLSPKVTGISILQAYNQTFSRLSG
jgi:hypothetical protein